MPNPFLGQILGSVLGGAMGRSRGGLGQGGAFPGGMGGGMGAPGGGLPGGMGRMPGGMGGMPGGMGGMAGGGTGGMGGLGSILGGAMGGGGLGGLGGRNAMLALLLPLAMQWVQRNGGIGNVLQRANQRGYGRHANSWVGTGENEPLDPGAIDEMVGNDEVMRMSQQLGVPEQEVREGFAEILPEMVDQLSPEGRIPEDADQVLDAGQSTLSGMLADLDRQRSPV
jgi:uncharacterized protein YidB (DUF937 family)